MINWFLNLFKKNPVWEYGYVPRAEFKLDGRVILPSKTYARRHRIQRNVQFILWKAGEQGHKTDYWHNFDSSWWPLFIPDKQD